MTISPSDLISSLEDQGVRLHLAEERLQVLAPKNVLTGELSRQIKLHREEIVEILRQRQDPATSQSSITRADRSKPLPLSFAQQRLWFLQQLDPESAEYTSTLQISLGGTVDEDVLEAAFSAVVARHEVLRTRLVADADGIPHQIIDPPTPQHLNRIDLTHTPNPHHTALNHITTDARTPFNLATGPLIRATLIHLTPNHHILSLCMHHAVFDEWSDRILRHELATLYNGTPLPPLPIQYADYATWQRQWLTGDTLTTQLHYWQTQLTNPPTLHLPTDHPRPAIRNTTGAEITFTIPQPTTTALQHLSRQHGTTMFMTLIAAYATLLHHHTGQTDILIGTPIANRNQPETEHLIGFFLNTLIIRTHLHHNPTFTELLHQTRTTALDAYTHQDLPFEQLVDQLTPTRNRAQTPLIQTLFNYVTIEQASGGPGDGGGAPAYEREHMVAKFDLTLGIAMTGDGALVGYFRYATALFDRPRIERLVEHLLQVLAGAVADPDQPVSRLAVLSAAERELLASWNATDAVLPAVNGVHALFEAQAARSPDTAAVVTDDGLVVTYAQLNARADQLASQLTGLGVGAETVVGLCLNRGIDTITAILAVWKAGGAYLPLDPAHPAERLAYMLSDSGAAMLITTGALRDRTESSLPAVVLDDPTTATIPNGQPRQRVHPEQAAYVIYTSGSTGRPKGVIATHHGLINYTLAIPTRTGTGRPGGQYALLQPATTDFGNTIILAALSTGGSLYLPDPDRTIDPGYLATFLHTHHIDYLKIVPSHLAALTTDHPLPELLPGDTLILGGERTPTTLAADLAQLPVQLINH
ncbi:non-ribosomal peptide synthetase, partial [Dactylosporangium darangshiense]